MCCNKDRSKRNLVAEYVLLLYHQDLDYCTVALAVCTFSVIGTATSLWLHRTQRCGPGDSTMTGAQGFLGCLSAVQVSRGPLKAALQPSRPAPITISGHVTRSSCVAQAGTDATSRERTHSFAGGVWLSFTQS